MGQLQIKTSREGSRKANAYVQEPGFSPQPDPQEKQNKILVLDDPETVKE